MLDEEDQGTRIGVWVALAVVFCVLVGLLGGLLLRQAHHAKQAVAGKATSSAIAEALIDAPLGGELVAKLYFDSGVAALPPEAAVPIDQALKQLMTTPSRRIVLAGFHDGSGDAKANSELAKRRAQAVRKALVALGADARRVLLRKPESTSGDGSLQEARRVEIRAVD